MASDHRHTVEFVIEVYPTCDFETEDEADLRKTVNPTNGLRRNRRCWNFLNWRLHRAAAAPNNAGLEEMKECVQLGADVNSKDSNARTALHKAAKEGNLGAAAYLVLQRADINAPDDRGSTPLVEAVRFNHNDLARFLVAKRRRMDEADTSAQRRTIDRAAQHRHVQEVESDTNNSVADLSFWVILRAFVNRIRSRKHDLIKWFIVIANVGLELCQAVASEKAGDGERYRDLTAGLSLICLVLSVAEFAYEVKKNGAKWRKRRGRYCFYYPGIHNNRVFGSFTLWFGLISSTFQFGLNVVAFVVKRAVVKFEYLGLLLAICLLLAAFMRREDEKENMKGAVMCVVHGECETEGGFKQGIWVFHCPECQIDKLA